MALRLGHRHSLDFDFFSATSFLPAALQRALPFAEGAEVLQMRENTLSLRGAAPDEVQVSFFGGLRMAQVAPDDVCPDNGVRVASARDLLATKLNTVFQRAEAKDYVDIHALLRSGLALADGLACAQAVYGSGFNATLPLKALTFFADGDLPALPTSVCQDLIAAVRSVHSIPAVTPFAPRIGGGSV
ncbi:MAG: nucleotidyl transferase AbiEii/AbiGii toxin family protein [Verrucomicrobia bacterium]|nr:nucleotidyl transferase AbiEii/AbiGii toxin family protein [Verrucomicrobiota bacterium]